MAGIEQIVVHSKSYVVRWIQVPEHNSISWSVQPQKKGINFGIFKHPGTKNGLTPILPTHDTIEHPITPTIDGGVKPDKARRRSSVANLSSVVEKLQSVGLKLVAWTGKCDADKVSMGRYDVVEGESGMYGLVLDNTFSKQTSKTVMFVVMTHPTNAPPTSGHNLHYSQGVAAVSATSVGKNYSPFLLPVTDSTESLPQTAGLHRTVSEEHRPNSKGKSMAGKNAESTTFYTGTLHKKRRKKGQGYAKRFFSLDFTSATLSYYRDRHSSALRGAVPLSLAAIGVNEKGREFSVDSGAEVWHLRASNKKDFDGWRSALERASAAINAVSAPVTPARPLSDVRPAFMPDPAEENEWARVEQLISKVAGTRDAVRGLAKDTDPKYMPGANGASITLTKSGSSSNAPSPSSFEAPSYFPESEERDTRRRPFWRKSSSERSPVALFRRSVSAQLAVPTTSSPVPHSPLSPTPPGTLSIPKHSRSTGQSVEHVEDVHERCMALLRDLDTVVSDFAALLAESKARRLPPLVTGASRMSIGSIDDQEFFDADDGALATSQLLSLGDGGEPHEEPLFDRDSDADSDISSDDGAAIRGSVFEKPQKSAHDALFPSPPQTLPPLPHSPVKRRTTIAAPKQSPPSIIGFLRKNAGKDLSTVAMPVTANEPTSLLERLAESLEYSHLLDSAASASIQPADRLLYVAAFAVSYFANSRVKERAIRKPFNPMLGETYELVREDKGFRFLAEKISHHPVRMACQAESLTSGGWCFAQSPQPVQKFWGKSVELNTEGRVRVVFHATNEHYSWNQATCFLRNVIAGEKYVEPVQSMTVACENTGMRAVVSFKSGGMFSGRSEDVTVQIFDPAQGDAALSTGLTGKWTEGLKRTDSGASIWTVGSLVPDAAKVYGFTTFAAELNEITPLELSHVAPTDSRLRPDQQALERNEVDKAEALKAHLEERQRARRKVMENHGHQWQPQWFEKMVVGDEEVWKMKETEGYWERRETGNWKAVTEVFNV